MSCRAKNHGRLAALDGELRERAVALLRHVAAGRGTDLFVTAKTNPWPEARPSPEGTELVERAEEIVGLAQRLGEDLASLVAPRLLRAFRAANDLSNPHRLGPIRLAAALLEELDPGGTR